MANVVALPKPFDLGDLLRLVRALCRPVPAAGNLGRPERPQRSTRRGRRGITSAGRG
jgi:hypothetical protein